MCEPNEIEYPVIWDSEQADVPDPYDRPDFDAVWPQEEAEETGCDPVSGLPLLPCAVCGLHTISEGIPACCCPVCGWQDDPLVQDVWEPSVPNRGLSLYEAQLNFRTFGWSDPVMLIQGEEKNDAEF